jgi:hypothetical protein
MDADEAFTVHGNPLTDDDALVCPTTDPQATYAIIQDAILDLWDIVNGLSLVTPPKRSRYSVTIFGSARLPQDSSTYAAVQQLATDLTRMGCDIITGGGPGAMEAANAGSVLADPENLTRSVGIRVALNFEQQTNSFVEQAFQHRTFFSRLHHFVLISDAFVVVPGGIGTTLEALMIWQLLQVRNMNQVPLILVGPMWSQLLDWARRSMVEGQETFADATDMAIPTCVDSFAAALTLLKVDHARWQQQC